MSEALEVRRGLRWGRHVGNALIAMSMLFLPFTCLGLCASASPEAAAASLGLLVGGGALWRLGSRGIEAIEARKTRRLLRAELDALLVEEGLSELDPADPVRIKRERAFWTDEQRHALGALRARFVVEPRRLDLLDAMRAQLFENARIFYQLGAACLATLCLCSLIGYIFYAAPLAIGALFGLGICISIISAALILLAKDTLSARSASREERRAFEQESRRIVTMAELAGGLTLAGSMDDGALRGALSPEVAQGGELEQVVFVEPAERRR